MSKELMSTGGGSSKGGMTGGAKKIITFTVGFFVLMMIVPNLDPMMNTANQLGSSVVSILGSISDVANQIATAFENVGGGQ